MSDRQEFSPVAGKQQSRWHWIVAIGLVATAIVIVLGATVVSRAEPILRARVIETLSSRFHSKVKLEGFHVSLLRGFQVSGEGLSIFGDTDLNTHQVGVQPLISVAEFRFRTGLMALFRSPMHVDTVYVKGLSLNLPPREQRGQMKNMSRAGKMKIIVHR